MSQEGPDSPSNHLEGQRPTSAQTNQELRARRPLVLAGVAAAVLAGIAFFGTRPEPDVLTAVETFPDQGQQHIDPGGPIPEYNSVPPTSGPHAPQSAPCGIYRQDVPDVFAVHSLEHGVVMVRYAPTIASTDRDALEAYVRDAGTHIVVSPRSGLEDPIVLTAWTKLLRLDHVDTASLDAFYKLYAQNGPERGVACPNEVDEAASNS